LASQSSSVTLEAQELALANHVPIQMGSERLAFKPALHCHRRYSIFGIGVDRNQEAKWLFHREKAAFNDSQRVDMYSENALIQSIG